MAGLRGAAQALRSSMASFVPALASSAGLEPTSLVAVVKSMVAAEPSIARAENISTTASEAAAAAAPRTTSPPSSSSNSSSSSSSSNSGGYFPVAKVTASTARPQRCYGSGSSSSSSSSSSSGTISARELGDGASASPLGVGHSSGTADNNNHHHHQQQQQHNEEERTQGETDPGVSTLKHRLLEASLAQVPEHGWSQAAVVAGAQQLGLSPAVAGLLCHKDDDQGQQQQQEPADELVLYFVSRCNKSLEDYAASAGAQLRAMAPQQRVYALLRARLDLHAPVIDTWAQAMARLAAPRNAGRALALLAQLSDTVCYGAGDAATDMRWYARRAAVGAIYTSTELYMLSDASPGFQDTWAALQRRLDDTMAARQAAAQLTRWVENVSRRLSSRMPRGHSAPHAL